MECRYTCVGCGKPILSGCELYHDRKINQSAHVRFYTHLDCLHDGTTQREATKVMADFQKKDN